MQWNVTTLDEFTAVSKEILQTLQSQHSADQTVIVCLHGDLGAGKTTMTQIIASQLGVIETLQSPTFVIRKAYETASPEFKKLVHIDAYRLGPDDNLDVLHFDQDFTTPDALVIIEWPEMIEQTVPGNATHVFIEHTGEGRVIRIENKKTA
jgi:tRNA threonylcarbamoyladenosine biosynthesis protein TsaE